MKSVRVAYLWEFLFSSFSFNYLILRTSFFEVYCILYFMRSFWLFIKFLLKRLNIGIKNFYESYSVNLV